MRTRITVNVYRTKQRPNYLAQWSDPHSGRKRTRSTGTKIKREALRFAGKLEEELNSGEFHERQRTLWADFRQRYESDVMPGKAKRTQEKFGTAFNTVERILNPSLLAAVDSAAIGRMVKALRKEEKSEATVKSYLTHLVVALRWAKRNRLLNAVPEIDWPKRAGGMKGRPITTEEFERLLSAVPKVIAAEQRRYRTRLVLRIARAQSASGSEVAALREKLRGCDVMIAEIVATWRHLLYGLWWSGLRLGEALNLHWTDDSKLCVDFSGRRPMFRIQASAEKGNKYRILPMAPEAAEFLQQNDGPERNGFVFDPMQSRDAKGKRVRLDTVSKRIAELGKAAGVKTAETAKGEPRYASAHDLRRAFGFRWSTRIMPAQLQELMRHGSITTTMEFYVGRNAEATADAVWSSFAKQSAKRDEIDVRDNPEASTQAVGNYRFSK